MSNSTNWYKNIKLSVTDIDKKRISDGGLIVIDERKNQGYELFLAKYILSTGENMYNVGFQKENMSAIDYDQQNTHVNPRPVNSVSELISFIKSTLREWISKYGPLCASSNNAKKMIQYLSILPALGFSIQSKKIYGSDIFFIS